MRSGSVIRHGRLHYQREFYRYLCKVCGRTFNDETGALLHYFRLRIGEFALEAILHLHMSVSSVSKLVGISYRYCYVFYTRFIHRLSLQPLWMVLLRLMKCMLLLVLRVGGGWG